MEWLAIDQDLHNSPETLEEIPAAELDANEPASDRRPRRSPVAWIIGIAALALGGTLVFESMPPEGNTPGGRQTQATQAAPVPVTVVEASTRDVPVYLDGLGTVQAINSVAIRTQVDGKLQSVNFVEGQQVHKGDVLAVVDPRPYQAVVDQAKAKRVEDEAQLLSDQKDLDRFSALVVKGAGTQQAVDQQQAKVDNLKATILADQAAIESAELSSATRRSSPPSTAMSASARSMPATSSMPPIRCRLRCLRRSSRPWPSSPCHSAISDRCARPC